MLIYKSKGNLPVTSATLPIKDFDIIYFYLSLEFEIKKLEKLFNFDAIGYATYYLLKYFNSCIMMFHIGY